MSDFNDGSYPHNLPQYDPIPGRQSTAYSTRRAPRYSRVTSWDSTAMLSGGPPSIASRPLPVPDPPSSRAMSGYQQSAYAAAPEPVSDTLPDSHPLYTSEPREERELEPESMTIGQSMDEDAYMYDPHTGPQEDAIPEDEPYPYPGEEEEPGPSKPKSRTKAFVGGFFTGVLKIPKVVAKSTFYDRKSTRKGAPGTELPAGPSHYLPAYNEPNTTALDPANVAYVQSMDMPAAQKTPTELSHANASRRVSQQRSSQRSSSHAAPSSVVFGNNTRFRSAPQSPDAVIVSPLPADDYAKMESPARFHPPDDSFSMHITRVNKFFHELKNLPWTSSRVALDYIPTESTRARVGKAKQSSSWYTTPRHQDIDLLAPAPGSARPATVQLRSEDGAASHASIRSASRPHPHPHGVRTPTSFMTSPGLVSSPGASSHGQGQHAISYSYYFSPPQPLYVYPTPMASPMTHHGTDISSAQMASPEPHQAQALPVYMVAGPPPGLLPTPPPALHTVVHNQPTRVSSPPANAPPTHPLSRHSGSNSH